MTAIYFRSDIILLDYFDIPSDEICQYAAAYRLIESVILLVNPISITIFRKVCLLEIRSFPKKNFILEHNDFRMSQYCFLSASTLTTNALVELSYGAQYSKASKLLPTFAWMVLPPYTKCRADQIALAKNLERPYATVSSLAAFINLAINFLLIPKYGILATAYCSSVTEVFLLMGLGWVIFKEFKKVFLTNIVFTLLQSAIFPKKMQHTFYMPIKMS